MSLNGAAEAAQPGDPALRRWNGLFGKNRLRASNHSFIDDVGVA
jgi:hypothetical protein